MFSSVAIQPGCVRYITIYPAAWKYGTNCLRILDPIQTRFFFFIHILTSIDRWRIISGPIAIEKSFCRDERRMFRTSFVIVPPIPGSIAGTEEQRRIIVGEVAVDFKVCGSGIFNRTSWLIVVGSVATCWAK
jgi:hypothetical protein